MSKMQTFGLLAIVSVLAIAAVSAPAHAQKYTDLYNFGTNPGDPVNPAASGIIAQGRDGNLYSTTCSGGANNVIFGAVFKITPEGSLTVLHSFNGTDGGDSCSGLTLGTDGNFYGATKEGGLSYGTVFRITSTGALTTLYTFTGGSDGAYPYAPPIQGADGNFYGTTWGMPPGNSGTVYKITASGAFTTLYQFDKARSGTHPQTPLVQGTDGNFYGTTAGKSTVFKITPRGKLRVLHYLKRGEGDALFGPLIQGSDGYFYGTAYIGGIGSGTVFRVTSNGEFTVLHSFTDGAGGAYPFAGMVQATDGNFYGTTSRGGGYYGTIYQITPQGSFSVLYNFDSSTGAFPEVTLLNHTNGILYGDTSVGGILSDCGGEGCGVFYGLDAGLQPFVSFVGPLSSGKVGKTIQILGQGFTGTTTVSFNGTAASFIIKSDTYLTAIVPVGATSGFVTVTTPGGLLTSNKQFQVKP